MGLLRPNNPEKRLEMLEGQIDGLEFVLGLTVAQMPEEQREKLLAEFAGEVPRRTKGEKSPYKIGLKHALEEVSAWSHRLHGGHERE